jgi:hypothetical protein
MSRTRLLLAAAILLSLSSAPAPAFWGEKHPACPRWVTKLEALEQGGDVTSARYRRLRNRIDYQCVALNEIQVLGSHNSFHVQPRPALLEFYLSLSPALFGAWEYTHIPLDQQFSTQGIRQIELDVFADPEGGLFARRGGLVLIGEDPNSGLPELQQPGFKVLHIQDYDFESTCLTFVACLGTVKAWSDAHPNHLPLTVLVELKDDPVPDAGVGGVAIPVPIGPEELDALDAEIRSVFPRRKLITPDDVRRGRATLEEGVLTFGWPRLGVARGKVLFLMDNAGHYRDDYLLGHPVLEDRVLFTNSDPGGPDAAFVKLNDPFDPSIPAVVAAGYLVRTRADADTVEARSGDTGPRDAALASGAQFVSTDYPVPDPDFGTGYFVEIPGGMPARCNPLNAPAGCRVEGLERLR